MDIWVISTSYLLLCTVKFQSCKTHFLYSSPCFPILVKHQRVPVFKPGIYAQLFRMLGNLLAWKVCSHFLVFHYKLLLSFAKFSLIVPPPSRTFLSVSWHLSQFPSGSVDDFVCLVGWLDFFVYFFFASVPWELVTKVKSLPPQLCTSSKHVF